MSVVAGVTMCKDEADIIEVTLRNMLPQVDFIYVMDNMSTDDTPQILDRLLDEFRGQLFRIIDNDPAYYQSKKMTAVADIAHYGAGADWIVPFDADEIWYSPHAPTLKERLDALGPQWQVVQADLYDQVCTAYDNPNQQDPTQRITWRTLDPLELPKVACRWRKDLVIGAGNHNAFYDDSGPSVSHDRFVVRHFPYRSPEQFVRKVRNGAAAYAATDLDENTGTHWRGYGRTLEERGEDALLDNVYYRWFYDQQPDKSAEQGRRPLINDPAPVKR